jgi:hypothetical protein
MEHPPLATVMGDVGGATNYTEAAISPDARWVSWAESIRVDGNSASIGSAIYLASAAHPNEVIQVSANP